jgi:hypothetical protein
MSNLYAGIDLDFRPSSYFWPLSLEKHLLATIKGAERQAVVRHAIEAGLLDLVPENLLESALSEDDRRLYGRIHPSFMGGEYLPKFKKREVEIARISLASVTSDVVSLRVRQSSGRFHYRVVDEYDGDCLTEKTQRTSTRPLTLGELEAFFNDAWSTYESLEFNFGCEYGDGRYEDEELLSFLTPSSEFYPEFATLHTARIVEWASQRRTERGLDEDDEDDDSIEQSPNKPQKPSARTL